MSYQVLARKWRPKNFAQVVGQDHVVKALTNALEKQRLHHAYLFTGTRGVGKTTIARILAKTLNCETGITPTPCGVCSACMEIDTGRFIDLIEVDAATNTKVDEMRQLLENAIYAPTRGRFKVYVIDEVHMLSNSAFNAMLKTLEEPPAHLKFILATTDPQKIPVTVLSRCLQFNLKQMPPQAIITHLAKVLEDEAVPFEVGALDVLSRSAAGSMRDALSLLDQAIAYGAGKVEEAQVRTMLGSIDHGHLFAILDALIAADATSALAVADVMAAQSLSFDSALQELAVILHRVAVIQQARDAEVAKDFPESARLATLAQQLDTETCQLYYQIALHGRGDLALAPDEYAGFTMTLLRMLAFSPQSVQTQRGATAAAAPVRPISVTAPVASSDSVAKSVEPAIEAVESAEMGPMVAARPVPAGDWNAWIDAMQLSGLVKIFAQHCELLSHSGNEIKLRIAEAHKHMVKPPAQEKLQNALREFLGSPARIAIELGTVQSVTPAARIQGEREVRQNEAESAIDKDPFVRDLMQDFGAKIVESSIKPVT